MSIALQTPPALHSFSNDFITAEFLSADYLQQVGVKSVNSISVSNVTTAGVQIVMKYGNRSVTMLSAYVPDESGFQFLCKEGESLPAANVYEYFLANHQLSTDFDISFSGFQIIFTAKEKSNGFDFSIGNTVVGKAEILKPNYRVFFRLFLENTANNDFEEIYSTYLSLYNGMPGVSIAQIGDKIHQKITIDIDVIGFEIPTTTPLICKVTCRRYYFQFAESYGDILAVKKLNTSPIFTVLYGGQSYQGRNNRTLQSLINPSTLPFDRFLRQGANNQFTREDQPQFLYFYNTRINYVGAKLMAKRTFINGSTDYQILATTNIEKGKKYAFNVSYSNIINATNTLDRYEVYLEDNSGNRISEKQTFYVKRDRQRFIRYFINLSSWGCLDSRFFTGKGQSSSDINYQKADRILGNNYKLKDGQFIIFAKKVAQKFKAGTGFQDASLIDLNRDFFLSTLQFRYLKNTIIPIEVTSTAIENPKDSDFLYAQVFEYQYLFSDSNYSESDIKEDISFGGSLLIPQPISPIIIYAGTPANPSLSIVQQQTP